MLPGRKKRDRLLQNLKSTAKSRRDAGATNGNDKVKDARLESKSRRPLQIRKQIQRPIQQRLQGQRRLSRHFTCTAKSGCATKGGRSEQRPYQFKSKFNGHLKGNGWPAVLYLPPDCFAA